MTYKGFSPLHKLLIKVTAVLIGIVGICFLITGKVPAQLTKASKVNGTSFSTEFINAACEHNDWQTPESMLDILMEDLEY